MSNPIINLEGIDIQKIDHQIFKNASLKIEKGEFYKTKTVSSSDMDRNKFTAKSLLNF